MAVVLWSCVPVILEIPSSVNTPERFRAAAVAGAVEPSTKVAFSDAASNGPADCAVKCPNRGGCPVRLCWEVEARMNASVELTRYKTGALYGLAMFVVTRPNWSEL